MSKFAIAIHGGAGPDSEFIHQHKQDYEKALQEAVDTGYKVLEKGGSAVDAVEATVRYMEDCYLFNAGKGGALTDMGKIEMCASIMDGKNRRSGAIAIVQNVKNPISLARIVQEKTEYIYVGDHGAKKLAIEHGVELMPDYYFQTEHALEAVKKKKAEEKSGKHGTVGAVALDKDGNLAAATSTGGLENTIEGRIADSSMVGVGCFASNHTCAVSSTGDGEYCIRAVVCHDVSAVMEYKQLPLAEAAHFVIHEKNKDAEGDMGVVCMDPQGNFAYAFNSERMHRAWRSSDGKAGVKIYPDKE